MVTPVFHVEPIIMVVVERKRLVATEKSRRDRDDGTTVRKTWIPGPRVFRVESISSKLWSEY